MSVNTKMTALADEIRELSGVTDKLGIDDMTTNVGNANDEISEQVSLLTQAIEALDGKAAGSSSGGEDVGDEVSLYTNKLTQLGQAITALETELENKAGGNSDSGGVEICTVTINFSGDLHAYSYMKCDGTEIDTIFYSTDSPELSSIILENVVCNSCIFCYPRGTMVEPAYTINGTAKILMLNSYNPHFMQIQAPSVAGESCTITVYDND